MNDFREYSNYLMHYGVKGMRWDHHIYAQPEASKGRRVRGMGSSFRTSLRKDEDTDTGKDDNGGENTEFTWENFQNAADQFENEVRGVGDTIESEIMAGNFGNAYNAYASADPSVQHQINNYVRNNYIYPALGGGDKKLGQRRVRQGEKIARTVLNGINSVISFEKRNFGQARNALSTISSHIFEDNKPHGGGGSRG